MAETRTKVYRTPEEMQADEADAAAHGWRVTEQRQRSDGTMSVTYAQGGSEWAMPTSPQIVVQPPPPAKKKPNPVAGCAVIIVVLLGLGYFFGNRGGTGGPTPPATVSGPTPTPGPTAVLVSGLGGPDRVVLAGGEFEYEFEWTNKGKAPAAIDMRVEGPSGKAKLLGCRPRCRDRGEGLGTSRLSFPDLAAGKSQTYTLTYLALQVGPIEWTVRLEDSDEAWGGTTVIR